MADDSLEEGSGRAKRARNADDKLVPLPVALLERSPSHSETVEQWQRTGLVVLSDELVKQAVKSAVSQLGPLMTELEHLRQQLEETQMARALCGSSSDRMVITRLEFHIKEITSHLASKDAAEKRALKHLQDTTLSASRAMSRRLASDMHMYSEAMAAMVGQCPGCLEEVNSLAAEMDNTGDQLKAGDRAEVVDCGKLCPVRVERCLGPDTYELSFWVELNVVEYDYEAGFDTRQPRLQTFKRVDIFAEKKKHQTVQSEASSLLLFEKEGVHPEKSSMLLVFLYAAAESSLRNLRALCDRLARQVPGASPVVPALKGMERVYTKTLEKYGGDFTRVTDIARGTINCASLMVLLHVLRELRLDQTFELVRIKNRIMLEYDADEAGGYRDMLINLVDRSNGHIVELQLTLAPLYEVKLHGQGGHVAYEVARMLSLFDKSVNEHNGVLTVDVLHGVDCGLIWLLECSGRASNLERNFNNLLQAVGSKHNALVKLILSECGWPADRTLNELLEVLMEECGHLTCVKIGEDIVAASELPDALFERLPKLRYLMITPTSESGWATTSIAGKIPSSIGCATHMEEICLWGHKLSGNINKDFGKLKNLKILQLNTNELSGCVPPELGQLQKLEILCLQENMLTGEIPATLGNLSKLEWLSLRNNALSGCIPACLGQLHKLTLLKINSNKLCGIIPTSIWNLTMLTELYLQDNLLEGGIPKEVGNLVNLEELCMNNNELSGVIPAQIGLLTKLKVLKLNDNNLCGEIPQLELGQLHETLIELSLENNKELKGAVPPQLVMKKGLQVSR